MLEKCFLVEGRKNVEEVLRSDFTVRSVAGTKSYLESKPVELVEFNGEILETDEAFLVDAGTFQSNQDCIAVVEMKATGAIEVSPDHHVFLLDGVSDPGNLGTIIRTLDWFGFSQLICSPDSTDFYNPKVINSSMGSFCRVQVDYLSLPDLIERVPRPVFGADMKGISLSDLSPDSPSYFVMGSESHGIREYLAPYITQRVTIPAFGKAESLNVGVATGIFAFRLTSL